MKTTRSNAPCRPFKAKILGIGSVTVAYRLVEEEWRCTALQFDIVGTGSSKFAAFQEMQELLDSYLGHVFRAKGKVTVFNPSDREEWEAGDKEEFHVLVTLTRAQQELKPRLNVDDVRALGKKVGPFELVPA